MLKELSYEKGAKPNEFTLLEQELYFNAADMCFYIGGKYQDTIKFCGGGGTGGTGGMSGINVKGGLPHSSILNLSGSVGDLYVVTDSGATWHKGDGFISSGQGSGVSNWTNIGNLVGPQGLPGVRGVQGKVGPAGLDGAKGDPGPTGLKGDPGVQGPGGPAGVRGPRGPIGHEGKSALIKGSLPEVDIRKKHGDTGDIWIITDTGTSKGHGLEWNPHVSGADKWVDIGMLQGSKGDQGPHGPKGDQGHQGIKGDQGSGIRIKGAVAEVVDLPTTGNTEGDTHLIIKTGDLYVWGADNQWHDTGHVQGPKGDQGPQGPHGADGHDGLDGKNGASMTLKGHKPEADIKAIAHPKAGDIWILSAVNTPNWHIGDALINRGPHHWDNIGTFKGDKGDAGPKGAKGSDGHIGPKGDPGIAGSKGVKGDPGTDGKDGTGVNIKGSDLKSNIISKHGAVGDMWIITDAGATHGHGLVSNGVGAGAANWTDVGSIQGPKGERGAQGTQGVAGNDGATGPQGQTGSQGPEGPEGPAGKDGADGHAGVAGKSALDVWRELNNKPNAPSTDYLAAIKGDKGDTGNQGIDGPQGHQGIKGDTGTGIHIKGAVTDVSKLPTTGNTEGDTHIVTKTGDLYIWGADNQWHDTGHVQGPKGDQGPQGPHGAVGPHGKDGVNGANGVKGDPGVAGPQGAKGAQGADGKDGTGVTIKGSDTRPNIMSITNAKAGDMWIITSSGADHGHGLVSNGPGLGWTDVGAIKGDKGDRGADGPQGPQGNVGPAGHIGAIGHTGATGPTGPAGIQGVKGDQGNGLDIKSMKDSIAVIRAIPNPEIGEIHLAKDTGNMWIFENPTPPHDIAGADWHEIGHVRGPIGPKGDQGPHGVNGTSVHIEGTATVSHILGLTRGNGTIIIATDTGTDSFGHSIHAGDGVISHNHKWKNIGRLRGPKGNTGAKGAKGDAGPRGATGATGHVGPKGSTGSQGVAGPAGPKGTKGDQGVIGPEGPQGTHGKDGTGVTIKGSASSATIYTKHGTAGDMWIITDAGASHGHGLVSDGIASGQAHWTDVGAIQGPRGQQGIKGAAGAKGSIGHTGHKGDPGAIGHTGPKGDPGPKGARGDIGLTGPKGADGPRGQKGATGIQGIKGDQGNGLEIKSMKNNVAAIRAIPNPEIGEIHLAKDTGNMWIWESPTPPHNPANADWHEIGHVRGPRGPKGNTGTAGKNGVDGVRGPKGDHGPQGPKGDRGWTRVKGAVAHVVDLPKTHNAVFDIRHVEEECKDYVWNGTSWDHAGDIIGPTGAAGPTGPKGDKGLNGVGSFKNIIINGNMSINQRGFDGHSFHNGKYCWDRWRATANGKLLQVIEEGNFEPGEVYILSGKGITTRHITAPTSGNFTVVNIPRTAREIQLELGTVVTEFERRPISIEKILCMRYFEIIDPQRCTGVTYRANGDTRSPSLPFQIKKRVLPTVVPGSITMMSIGGGDKGSYVNRSSTFTFNIKDSYITLAKMTNADLVGKGIGISFYWGATIGSYIRVDADFY